MIAPQEKKNSMNSMPCSVMSLTMRSSTLHQNVFGRSKSSFVSPTSYAFFLHCITSTRTSGLIAAYSFKLHNLLILHILHFYNSCAYLALSQSIMCFPPIMLVDLDDFHCFHLHRHFLNHLVVVVVNSSICSGSSAFVATRACQ